MPTTNAPRAIIGQTRAGVVLYKRKSSARAGRGKLLQTLVSPCKLQAFASYSRSRVQFPSAWYQCPNRHCRGETTGVHPGADRPTLRYWRRTTWEHPCSSRCHPLFYPTSWDREVGAEHLARMPQTLTSTPKARRMKSRDRNREAPNPKPKCPSEDDYLMVN